MKACDQEKYINILKTSSADEDERCLQDLFETSSSRQIVVRIYRNFLTTFSPYYVYFMSMGHENSFSTSIFIEKVKKFYL